ncbi:aspartate carbamoyltransferase regulatory subunit [Candidatus Woesearchaeota archaeon]|nr:aspartate carbamoyltransferase regulatory subunit [Candidatus Woesearchaeota archaeon]
MKEFKISAIKEGTVIDHIPADQTFKVAQILRLGQYDDVLTVATNLKSGKMGKKGIVKIGGKFLTDKEVNKIALIAPSATVSIIKNYKVEGKQIVKIPDELDNIALCINPNCITNHTEMKTLFTVVGGKPVKARCHYCERCIDTSELEIK